MKTCLSKIVDRSCVHAPILNILTCVAVHSHTVRVAKRDQNLILLAAVAIWKTL